MNKKTTDNIEILINKIMRLGIGIAAIVIFIGLLNFYLSIVPLAPIKIIRLGIFLLILTPILRVIVSIYAFFKQKDWLYMTITSIVFIILGLSFIIGYWR